MPSKRTTQKSSQGRHSLSNDGGSYRSLHADLVRNRTAYYTSVFVAIFLLRNGALSEGGQGAWLHQTISQPHHPQLGRRGNGMRSSRRSAWKYYRGWM